MNIALLAERVETLARMTADRLGAQEQAARVALESIDKRLEGMNAFRGALADQASEMMTRAEARSEIGAINKQLDEAARPNWTLIIAALTMGLAIFGGVWTVLTLRIDASTMPAMLGLQGMQAGQSSQDERLKALEASQRVQDAKIGALAIDITRSNVWLDFVQAELFPSHPSPPLKQP